MNFLQMESAEVALWKNGQDRVHKEIQFQYLPKPSVAVKRRNLSGRQFPYQLKFYRHCINITGNVAFLKICAKHFLPVGCSYQLKSKQHLTN